MTKTSQLSNASRLILGVAVIFFVLAFLWNLSGTKLATGLAGSGLDAVAPMLRLRAAVLTPLSRARFYLDSKADLSAENGRLRQQLALAESKLARLEQIERENEKLEALLGRGQAVLPTRVAKILADQSLSAADLILIDVGGTVPGQLVTQERVILVGQIAQTAKTVSKVRLYSSPGVTASALIGEAAESVKVEGRGGGSMYARVPRGFAVREGDRARVLVAGETYILGIVSEIKSSDRDPFQELFIALPNNLNLGDYVNIHQQVNEASF